MTVTRSRCLAESTRGNLSASRSATWPTKLSSLESWEGSARYYYDNYLKHSGWHYTKGKLRNWRYVPVQYGKSIGELIQAGGIEGKHFADGDESLSNMLEKYGIFEGIDENGRRLLKGYCGPPLGQKMVSQHSLISDDGDTTRTLQSIDTTNPNSSMASDNNTMRADDQEYTTSDSPVVSNPFDDDSTVRDDDFDSVQTYELEQSENQELEISNFEGGEHNARTIVSEVESTKEGIGHATSKRQRQSNENEVLEQNENEELEISNFQGGTHNPHKIVSEQAWRVKNQMPYGYLENVLDDLKNHIFVGKYKGKIRSVFAFRFVSKDDASILLLWTEEGFRRKGFASRLMQEGCAFLIDDSFINGGTNTTPDSQALNDILALSLGSLRKALQEKCNQKSTGDFKEWEMPIPRDVIESYKKIPSKHCTFSEESGKVGIESATSKRKRQCNDEKQSTPRGTKTKKNASPTTTQSKGSPHQVGTIIRKRFQTKWYEGQVTSYDPVLGFYKAHYRDGHSEELTHAEVSKYRKPKQRYRRGRPARADSSKKSRKESNVHCSSVCYPEELRREDTLVELYQKKLLCDITFSVDDNEYHAHKNILITKCKKLYEVVEACGNIQVPILDMRSSIFASLLEFIYTVQMPVIQDKAFAIDLLKASNRYDCTDLKLYVESILVKKFLCVGNAAELLIVADSNACALLKEAAINLFVTNTQAVMKTNGYSKVKEKDHLVDELFCGFGNKKNANEVDVSGVTSLRHKLREHGRSREELVRRVKAGMSTDSSLRSNPKHQRPS